MTDWWQSYPWRLIQTNLREVDMLDIQAEQVIADLLSFNASILMINAAGIIASYPTSLPFHFQSPFLKGDSLQEIISACHKAGIRVIARTDFSKVRRPIYEAHPDWAYLTPTGQIVDYNGDVHVCLNSPYQQEGMLQIIEELLSSHDFDGIFFNMSGYGTHDYHGRYYGVCHCANCQRLFKEMFNLPLPERDDWNNPVYPSYADFKRRTAQAHQERVYRFITDRWPHVCIANHLPARRGFIRQESNTAIDRALPHWQYSASDNTRWAVGSYPEMVCSNTTVDFIDFPYRHAAVSPHQQALRLAQALANGGSLDYYLIGRLDNHQDRSGFQPVKEIFQYHARNAGEYAGLRSKAAIALVKPASGSEEEYKGWFRILAENHFLFDVLVEDAVTSRPLAPYHAIILPGVEALRDALVHQLDSYVNDGGRLLATGQSGFRDEFNRIRTHPALKCLGIHAILTIRQDMRSSYFLVSRDNLFPRLGARDLVYMDGAYVVASYAPSAQPHWRLVPPHRYGPPERTYYEVVTDHPGFVVNTYGKGRACYLPWLPATLFHRQGHDNTMLFCADLLEQVLGLAPVGGSLPPMVEVTLHEQSSTGSLLLHLVNGSGHFGNSFYEPIPLNDVQVSLPIPSAPSAVYGIRSGKTFTFTWQDEQLHLHIPQLGLFEAIKISF
jgi:hypothetical protein